jgi:chitin disaccharide deacetylase
MKHIIINADDLGADVCRNQGIAEAVAAGVVTSVSVLVNGPAFGDALDRLPAWQDRGVSVGLHMNLSEGNPVGKDLCLLPAERGCFRGKSSTHKLLMQKGNKELEREIALEINAQIGLLKSKGIRISHLDGHQHVHVFPAVIEAAVRAAQRHRIVWLRIPEERPLKNAPFCHSGLDPKSSNGLKIRDSGLCRNDDMEAEMEFFRGLEADMPVTPTLDEEESPLLCREAALFSRLATAARPFLNGSGIRTTDFFRGLYAKGRLSLAYLEDMLSLLPSGLTELMVHPGRTPAEPDKGPFAAFSNADRQRELEVLLDPIFLKILKGNMVFLTPYPETRT